MEGITENRKTPFIACVSGCKNSGKTAFLTGLLSVLKKKGLRTAVIKHDGHSFEPDVPGTDSYRLRKAGAEGVAVFCSTHCMIIKNKRTAAEELLTEYADMDLILFEGLKDSSYPKFEIVRSANSDHMVCAPETVIAVASDCPAGTFPGSLKQIGLADYEKAADMLLALSKQAASG